MYTWPVNHSLGPGFVSRLFLVICMAESCPDPWLRCGGVACADRHDGARRLRRRGRARARLPRHPDYDRGDVRRRHARRRAAAVPAGRASVGVFALSLAVVAVSLAWLA